MPRYPCLLQNFFLLALLTKIPKSPTTHIISKIPSPLSINKILKIPHYLHLLQNFISFLNCPSPSSLKFYFPATRDLFIWVLSLSHPQLLLPLLKEIFFSFFPQVFDFHRYCTLSFFFSLLFLATRDLFVWVFPFSHPQLLLSLLRIFFSAHRSTISTGTALCFYYPYQFFLFFFDIISNLPDLIFVQL